MSQYIEIKNALKEYLLSLDKLKELKVLKNKTGFTCQLGEWLVANLYDGEIAKSGAQKHWDIKINDKRIQVKTHAKATSTNAKFSAISYDHNSEIDELIIIVFTHDYKLTAFYKAPWKEAFSKISYEKTRNVIYWNRLKNHQIDISDLPKQDLVALFR